MMVMKAPEKKSCAALPVFITTFRQRRQRQKVTAAEMDVRRYVKALTLIHIFSRRDNNGWAAQKHPHLLLKVTHEQTVDLVLTLQKQD